MRIPRRREEARLCGLRWSRIAGNGEKVVNGEGVPVVIIIEDAPGVGLGWDPQICESGQMEE
jgi:hypothetical protein